MKYKITILVFSCLVLVVFLFIGNKKPQNLELFHGKIIASVNKLDTQSLQQRVAKMEYHIHFNKEKNTFSAPNRQQNLRFEFTKKGFVAKTRDRNISKIDLKESKQTKSLKVEKNNDLPEAQLTFEIKNFGKKGHEIIFDNPKETVYENQYFLENEALKIESINSELGMRQNYIVKQKPNGNGSLLVNIETKSNMAAVLKNNEIIFELKDKNHPQTYSYSDLKVWDANQKILASYMKLENNTITLVVNDKGAIYPITIDPIIAKANPSNASTLLESNQANSYMGSSVSSAGDVNGDGYSDVLVAATQYDDGQVDEGVVFVFHGSASGLSTTAAILLQLNTQNEFGSSVSTAGDVNGDGYSDVIIGSQYYTSNVYQEGAAFIYHGSATGLSNTYATILTGTLVEEYFGGSVACAGDVNGDGFSDVIVGSTSYEDGQSGEGAAFIYHGSATGINTTAATLIQSNKVGATMGVSVSSAGDVNADGFSDVIVGASNFENGQNGEGAAFIYHGSSSGIDSTYVTMLESNQAYAQFGVSVSCAGDVNGDGYSDVIVGAVEFENGESSEGSAFVYHGSPSGIGSSATTTIENNQASSGLGYSVASCGDINDDGFSDVIVGAYNFNNGESKEGVSFIYYGTKNGTSTSIVDSIQSNQADAKLGYSVASAGDVNGDGYSDVIVGAFTYDNGQAYEGAAFVYHGAASGLSSTEAIMVESNQDNSQFGFSVASAGDVNGDGYSDVIIGAPAFDNGETDEGAAFVCHGSATGISSSYSTLLESNQVGALLGYSVASAGDVNGDGYSDVIVGAFVFDNGQTDEGAAFIYHGSSTGISSTYTTLVESNQASAYLGISVASAGDVNGDGYSDVIVGAYYFDNGETNEGAAFIYHGSSTGISSTYTTLVESNQASAYLGVSVASAGDVNGDGYNDVIVGAYNFDNGQTGEGSAFVYHGSSSGISTTYSTLLESNQVGANIGVSVSSAGDVNGDGYSDVIVGAHNFDNGEINEGAAFVYHGSATGISSTYSSLMESNQVGAALGRFLSSAGDVNGDGYSDVIVGAYVFDNGETNEGAAFVYHGSATGIISTATTMFESNQADAYLGLSVASAGDVNGDGYSDVIVGAHFFDNGETNEGAAFVYHGGGGTGLRNQLRLTNANGTTLININNVNEPSFGVNYYTKNFLGRDSLQMVWQLRAEGTAFSSAGGLITNSVARTGIEANKTNVSFKDTFVGEIITKISGAFYNKIRVRTKYSMEKAITGQMYGPWHYLAAMQAGNMTHNFVPLPIDILSFDVVKQNCENKISFNLGTENNDFMVIIEKSTNGFDFIEIYKSNGNHSGIFSFLDKQKNKTDYYRLKLISKNMEIKYSEILEIGENCQTKTIVINLFPNPASDIINFELKANNEILKEIRVFDLQGKLINVISINEKINGLKTYQFSLLEFTKGNYFASFLFNNKIENIKFIVY